MLPDCWGGLRVFWHCSVFALAFLLSTGHQALIFVVPSFLGEQNDDIWFWNRITSLLLMIGWTLQLSGEMLPPKSWNWPHRSFKIPKSAGCAASSGGINLQSTWVCLGCKNVKRLNLCWLSGQRFLPSKKKTEQSLDCSKSEIYHHDKKSGFRISWGNETGSCSHVLTSWPRQIVFMTASFR